MKRISRHVDAAAEQTGDTWAEQTPSKAHQRKVARRQPPVSCRGRQSSVDMQTNGPATGLLRWHLNSGKEPSEDGGMKVGLLLLTRMAQEHRASARSTTSWSGFEKAWPGSTKEAESTCPGSYVGGGLPASLQKLEFTLTFVPGGSLLRSGFGQP